MDKKIKSKDIPKHTNYDLFTDFWNKNENIKNNCSYKNSEHPRLKRNTYKRIASSAKRMLKKRGFKVGH